MIFPKRLKNCRARVSEYAGLIGRFGFNWATAFIILLASNFVQQTSPIAYAGLIVLDDFNDDSFSEVTPLETFREYEDQITEDFGALPLSGAIFLDQNPGKEAVLRYNTPGGYDYIGIDRFIFEDAFLSSELDVVATLKINSVDVATGIVGIDADSFPILTFDLGGPLGVADSISFHFTTSGTDPFFFGSSGLSGSGNISSVPEPTSLLLVGMTVACGGTLRLVKRRRKASVSID